MIVAYNALSLRPGVFDGAATYTLNLLAHLPAALPDARFVVLARAGEDRISAADRVEVRSIPIRGAASRIAFESVLGSRELRRAEADVLLSPNESIPLGSRRPVVVVAQNLAYHRDGGGEFLGAGLRERTMTRLQAAYYRARMKRTYRRATAMIAVSAETARVLADRAELDLAKTVVVHEGADSILLPPPGPEREREPRLLVVSTIAPYKNLGRTLELYAALRESRPELELTLAGSDWRGYRAVIERRAAALGLPALQIEPQADPARLAELYSTAQVLVHLSACEAFGLPIVEAMRYGLPVVAADRSSLPEVAGGAALLVDPDDLDRTASAVGGLLASPGARASLAEAGRRRAEELTWSNAAARIAAVVAPLASTLSRS